MQTEIHRIPLALSQIQKKSARFCFGCLIQLSLFITLTLSKKREQNQNEFYKII